MEKVPTLGGYVGRSCCSVKGKGMKDEANLELGILRVALLITALDGHIDTSEYDMFHQLLASCHIVSGKAVLRVFSSTRRQAERLAENAAAGDASAVIKTFLEMADSACDWNALVEEPSYLRKAFAMWTAMAMADSDYCAIERMAIQALQDKVNKMPRITAGFLSSTETTIAQLRELKDKFARSKSNRTKILLRARSERLLEGIF